MSMSPRSSRLVKKIQFQVESLSSLKKAKYQVQLWVIVYDLSFLRPKFGALKQFRRGPFTFSTPVRMNRSDHPSLIKTRYFTPNRNWNNESPEIKVCEIGRPKDVELEGLRYMWVVKNQNQIFWDRFGHWHQLKTVHFLRPSTS